VITVKSNRPPGIGLARVVIAKVLARLDAVSAVDVVSQRWPDDEEVKNFFMRANVPAATTSNASYLGNLVEPTTLAQEFLDFLRPQTIIGKIPNLQSVPFNVRIASQTSGAVANWVGQGKAKPVTSFGTGEQTLGFTKIAAIAVITEEVARFSSPSAEALVRRELSRAVIERMDIDFIDPTVAAVTNVNPASITNGLTPLSSAGTDADAIRTDIQNILEFFLLNNQNAAEVVLIMPATLALAASLQTNAFGQPEFPAISMTGGTLRGITVVTSQYAANQSGAGNLVIALDPQAILIADDGTVRVDASREASIEMSDAPAHDSVTPTAASLVSMYQTNSVAIRAERFINWAKARSTAVVYMDDVNWGAIGSPS
jgi:HK97 family phage major capsid protein